VLSDEQFVLNRLGDSAIDIYAMVVILSRCTRSLNKQLASAEHETMLVKLFCNEVRQGREGAGWREGSSQCSIYVL